MDVKTVWVMFPWTLERVLIKARETYQDKYNYELIVETHIKGCESHIPIICNRCLCI